MFMLCIIISDDNFLVLAMEGMMEVHRKQNDANQKLFGTLIKVIAGAHASNLSQKETTAADGEIFAQLRLKDFILVRFFVGTRSWKLESAILMAYILGCFEEFLTNNRVRFERSERFAQALVAQEIPHDVGW